MEDQKARLNAVEAKRSSPTVTLLVVPALVSLVLIAVIALIELGVGFLLGTAGIAYVITATALGLLTTRSRTRLPLRENPTAQLEVTWLVAWIAGILVFALVGVALVPTVGDGVDLSEGVFVLSPIFWLLAVPFVTVYLVSTPVVRWLISGLRPHPSSRPGGGAPARKAS